MSEGKGLAKAAMHMAGHILVGTFIFAVIALAAFGLEQLVHWLKDKGAGEEIVLVLGIVEHGLFYLDVFLFVIMLLGTAWQFVREVWSEAFE
jgi:hypothetical protein